MEQGKWRFIVISLLLSDTQKNITYQEMINNSILGGWSSFLFLFFKHIQHQLNTTFQNKIVKILKDNNYIYIIDQ